MKSCLKYYWFVLFPDTVYSAIKQNVTLRPGRKKTSTFYVHA